MFKKDKRTLEMDNKERVKVYKSVIKRQGHIRIPKTKKEVLTGIKGI